MKKILMCFSLLAIMQSSMGMYAGEQPLEQEFGRGTLWVENDGRIVSLLTEQDENARFEGIKRKYMRQLRNVDEQNKRSLIYMNDRLLDEYFSKRLGVQRIAFLTKHGRDICVPAAPAPQPPAPLAEQPLVPAPAPAAGAAEEQLLAGAAAAAVVVPAPAPAAAAAGAAAAEAGRQQMPPQVVEEPDGDYYVNVGMPPVRAKLDHDDLRKFQAAGVLDLVVNSLIKVSRSTTQTSSLIYCISHWLFDAQLSDCIPVGVILPDGRNNAAFTGYLERIHRVLDKCKSDAGRLIDSIKDSVDLNDHHSIYRSIRERRDDFKDYLDDNFIKRVVAEYRQIVSFGNVHDDKGKREALRAVLQAFISAYYASNELCMLAKDGIINYEGSNGCKSAYRAYLLEYLVRQTIKPISAEYGNSMLLPDNVVKNIYEFFKSWE